MLGLTVILAVTIVFVDRGRTAPPPVIVVDGALNVEEGFPEEKRQAYYADLERISEPIFRAAETNEGDASAVRIARDQLLRMTVPGDERETHIRLIAAANVLMDGISGDADAFADAQLRVKQLYGELKWLQ